MDGAGGSTAVNDDDEFYEEDDVVLFPSATPGPATGLWAPPGPELEESPWDRFAARVRWFRDEVHYRARGMWNAARGYGGDDW